MAHETVRMKKIDSIPSRDAPRSLLSTDDALRARERLEIRLSHDDLIAFECRATLHPRRKLRAKAPSGFHGFDTARVLARNRSRESRLRGGLSGPTRMNHVPAVRSQRRQTLRIKCFRVHVVGAPGTWVWGGWMGRGVVTLPFGASRGLKEASGVGFASTRCCRRASLACRFSRLRRSLSRF